MSQYDVRRGIISRRLVPASTSEMVFMSVHQDTASGKLDALQFEERPLQNTGFPRQKDTAAAPEHTLPWQTRSRACAQRPCHLARCARVTGCACNLSVCRDLPAGNLPDNPANILEVPHLHRLRRLLGNLNCFFIRV